MPRSSSPPRSPNAGRRPRACSACNRTSCPPMPATADTVAAVASVEVAFGFDFGSRRIGVAVGNGITGQARALTTIAQTDWPAIDRLIAQWHPQALIVGLPLSADGSDQPITRQARAFMAQLAQRCTLPVHAVDERYSTIEAADRLRAARARGSRSKRLRKGDTDAVAAQVILESWFETS